MGFGEGAAPPRGGERGVALVSSMVAVVVAAGLSVGLLAIGISRVRGEEDALARQAAFAAAEAGLARGLAEANLPANRSDPWWPPPGLLIDGRTSEAGRLRDAETGDLAPGVFVVAFFRGDMDGIDNDGNGLADWLDPGERDFVTIVSTGWFGDPVPGNRHRVRLEQVVQKVTRVFVPQAAMFIHDAAPDLEMVGTAMFISGFDHDMASGTVLSGGGMPAVATTGALGSADLGELLFRSMGSSPTVTAPSPLARSGVAPSATLEDLVRYARNNVSPDHVVHGDGEAKAGPFGTPPGYPASTPAAWTVTVHEAGGPGHELRFSEGARGAGVWLVDGDLFVSGDFQFTGVLLVTGSVRFSEVSTSKTLRGAVVAGGNGTDPNITTDGSIRIEYSSRAVTTAGSATGRFEVRSWRKLSSEP